MMSHEMGMHETVRGSGGCVGLVGGSSGSGLPPFGLVIVSFFGAMGRPMQRAVRCRGGRSGCRQEPLLKCRQTSFDPAGVGAGRVEYGLNL